MYIKRLVRLIYPLIESLPEGKLREILTNYFWKVYIGKQKLSEKDIEYGKQLAERRRDED